jgi:hypothetical protein
VVRLVACAAAAAVGLAAGVLGGTRAYADATRKPTAAELSAASAIGVAQRWERLPAGQVFPAAIKYSTELLTTEKATRLGIATAHGCAAALDSTGQSLAQRYGCAGGLRASYADQLRGVIYTVGVLAFPTEAKASTFYDKLPVENYPATGLHALALPGTPAALFTDRARQAATSQLAGPYVVLAVAGYADGRPASTANERRDSDFDPAGALAKAVADPLGKPRPARCGTTEWACLEEASAPPTPTSIGQIRPAEMFTLDQIGVSDAWRVSRGKGVTVGVLDTGADTGAPDLAGVVRTGPDYTLGADPPGFQPPHLHGTYISSLIAGHGSGPGRSEGIIGVAPSAKVLSVRVILDDNEPGMAAYDDKQKFAHAIGNGIKYAVSHGVNVINMSLGSEQPTAFLRSAVAYAINHGVVVIASAGNNGTSTGFAPYIYPASFTGVIGVAAVNDGAVRASFSEQNAGVVLSAPGVGVWGAGPGGEYLDADGTSPAAALVSGIAALIKSRYPNLSPALVEQALVTTTTHRPHGGYNIKTGFGEADAPAALAAAGRLAAGKPSGGVAPAVHFASAPGPIQVVHRDAAGIAGYSAVGGAGLLVFAVALALLVVAARRKPAAVVPGAMIPDPATWTPESWTFQNWAPPQPGHAQPDPAQPPPQWAPPAQWAPPPAQPPQQWAPPAQPQDRWTHPAPPPQPPQAWSTQQRPWTPQPPQPQVPESTQPQPWSPEQPWQSPEQQWAPEQSWAPPASVPQPPPLPQRPSVSQRPPISQSPASQSLAPQPSEYDQAANWTDPDMPEQPGKRESP